MAYRSYNRPTRRTVRGRTGYGSRARSTRRAPARRTGRVSRKAPVQEIRLVIDNVTGGAGVSRYPGVAAKLNPPARKAKF